MKYKVNLEHDYQPTFRTSKVAGLFDLEPKQKLKRTWDIDLPIDNIDWQIGVIVGSSGSGKTTISKEMFKGKYKDNFIWGNDSILEYFPKNMPVNNIVNILSRVGFSSPPNWLLPYRVLSNGQKFRVDVARALCDPSEVILIDEFTSVVDRSVAKIGSAAISKFIKKQNKKFVAVSCHYDILEWLEPDWVFDVDSNEFKMVRLRRPPIKLQIYKCDKTKQQAIWQIFKHHHYLTSNLSPRSIAYYALINNEFCGFTSYLTMPISTGGLMYREHRTVILPDYQGIGLGNKLSEFLAKEVLLKFKKRLYSLTSHPAMIFYRNKSKSWQMTRKPSILKPGYGIKSMIKAGSHNRLTASFKFIGKLNNPC